MMSPSHDPTQNRLLAHLAATDLQRLQPDLKLVPLSLGQVLYESGVQLRHAYFPTTAIVSLLYTLADGASAEIAIIGNDGLIGVSLLMGGTARPAGQWSRAQVMPINSPGNCSRMSSIEAEQHSACCCATRKP